MPEPISLAISVARLGSLTDAVFAYALEQSGLGEKARAWRGLVEDHRGEPSCPTIG